MNLNSLFMYEGNQASLITCIIPSQRWSMVATASCSGGVFQRQGLGKWSEKTESWMQLNTEISFMKTWFRVLRTSDWAESAPANMTITLCSTHTAKTMQEWLRDDSMNVLEWPCQSWNLEPIRHLWRNLINGCPPMVPRQSDRAWDDLKRRMAKIIIKQNADVQSLWRHTQKDPRL